VVDEAGRQQAIGLLNQYSQVKYRKLRCSSRNKPTIPSRVSPDSRL